MTSGQTDRARDGNGAVEKRKAEGCRGVRVPEWCLGERVSKTPAKAW